MPSPQASQLGVRQAPGRLGMLVRIREIGKALHPNEVVVEVKTSIGVDGLVVDRRSIQNNALYVGSPVGQKGKYFLIELPRETMRGSGAFGFTRINFYLMWRLWGRRDPYGSRDQDSDPSGANSDTAAAGGDLL